MLSRTNFLPRILVIALVGSVPVVTACGARVVPLGSTGDSSDKLSTLDTSSVAAQAQNVTACPAGFAHPNICCEATAGDDPTCGDWENDPFRACDPGWSTYPNALSCCSLSNPTDCIDTPEDAGITTSPPPAYGCGFLCPPGWYAPGNTITPAGTTVSCCQTQANGITACTGVSSVEPVNTCFSNGGLISTSGGVPSGGVAEDGGVFVTDASVPTSDGGVFDGGVFDGGVIDGGVIDPYDAGYPIGECDAGDPYPPGFDGGIASLCEACPTGWTPDVNDPVLCCRVAASGVSECFSQATGTPGDFGDDGGVSTEPTTTEDAGVVGISDPVPTEDAGAPTGGQFCSASGSSCSCQNDTNGHAYVLDCSVDSSGKTTCFCEEDGTVTSQFSPATATCSDLSALGSVFSASTGCGYPAP